ncbi:ribosomal protein S18 acetylase RimI-like enzyme [Sediminihabitans luteus]|uniref:Ribosomal protein S18 acetylase RimI-like enzyme n=1 Tax=Sediminihabitans luteus TaxID=1138585 RepID=A0A2M9CPI4_9CELL|nr:GNAT family N-acetyltransferase [Sediminihabitans luteus]PJJ73809.1 ribosomal protein S18 acetylase RimI-like enzyme [Sediminihabitans luteus]GIJ00486.1 N-acetyltransferase [Sediminihabitans luteus]
MTPGYDDVAIRPATIDDAPALAAVHVASWKRAYAGIVADEYLASLDVTERARALETVLSDETPSVTWVALGDARTLGFATIGPSRDEDAEPGDQEIYSIYLDPEAWGRGVARDLMRSLLRDVSPRTTVSLWILADNERAQHFYRRHGFAPDGVEKREDIGGQDLTQVRFRRS